MRCQHPGWVLLPYHIHPSNHNTRRPLLCRHCHGPWSRSRQASTTSFLELPKPMSHLSHAVYTSGAPYLASQSSCGLRRQSTCTQCTHGGAHSPPGSHYKWALGGRNDMLYLPLIHGLKRHSSCSQGRRRRVCSPPGSHYTWALGGRTTCFIRLSSPDPSRRWAPIRIPPPQCRTNILYTLCTMSERFVRRTFNPLASKDLYLGTRSANGLCFIRLILQPEQSFASSEDEFEAFWLKD